MMFEKRRLLTNFLLAAAVALTAISPATAFDPERMASCEGMAYSTEEEFVTRGPLPFDGNPIISDGDLLSRDGTVCARNRELLEAWELRLDLGLDAVDVLNVDDPLIAFSTELDDPAGRFNAGDLLFSSGAVIPNAALLTRFQVSHDLGLDALHFVGELDAIHRFAALATESPADIWLQDGYLPAMLNEYGIDIWFSTEGTERRAAATAIYDGDLLSAASGIVVLTQAQLMLASVPAGIPNRGVDFGLDAATGFRKADRPTVRFSTEILYRGADAFTDGDILHVGNGVQIKHPDLVKIWEPNADFLGLDALYLRVAASDGGTASNPDGSGDPDVDEDLDGGTDGGTDGGSEGNPDGDPDSERDPDGESGSSGGDANDLAVFLPYVADSVDGVQAGGN